MVGPCYGEECLRSAEDVLAGQDKLYMACPYCLPEPGLEKNVPFCYLQTNTARCSVCDRAPLDLVMLEALEILVELGLRDQSDTLKSVGWPLVEIGYPLAYSPRLGPNDLIIVGENLSKQAAQKMVNKISEIKGVILGGGVPGVVDSKVEPRVWELLAGSDLRCDVVQSLFGELLIYKSQSQVHVEFPRQNAPKMRILENLYFRGKITEVADCLCGPGTFGLMCVLAGAKKVILNDIWRPAVENVMLNLEANRSLLGIEEIERPETSETDLASDPRMIGLATGDCQIEVYHGDLTRLFSKARPADLCLIDPFPGMKTSNLIDACRLCGEIVIV
ncbi:MAG: methyltransferase [Methanotrichaceae archaeon]